jgi:transposase
MGLKVRLAPRAIADLDAIRAYLTERNKRGAERVRQRIEQAIITLSDFHGGLRFYATPTSSITLSPAANSSSSISATAPAKTCSDHSSVSLPPAPHLHGRILARARALSRVAQQSSASAKRLALDSASSARATLKAIQLRSSAHRLSHGAKAVKKKLRPSGHDGGFSFPGNLAPAHNHQA